MNKQKGIGLSGLLVAAVIIVFGAILGFRLLPAYIDHYTIGGILSAIAKDPEMKTATPKDVRVAFSKRVSINNIRTVGPEDLEIAKEGDRLTIRASYSTKVPLVGNLSACMDFVASSE